MAREVRVDTGPSRYAQIVSVGPHVLPADEPGDVGGRDAGPNPYELLLAALGACTSMTVQLYADRRQWPLRGVHVSLSHAKVHADDCAHCDTEIRMLDQIDMAIVFDGDLSTEQQQKLMEVAERCPVHRTLDSSVRIRSRLDSR